MIHSVYQNRRGRYKGQRGDFVRALKLFAVYVRRNGLARRAEQEQRSAQQLYRAFGRHVKFADCWKKYIISSEPEFEHYFGKQAAKKRKLYNGRLQCNVYMYF